jgi:hypothetical protein
VKNNRKAEQITATIEH